jgi:hypothetical protein
MTDAVAGERWLRSPTVAFVDDGERAAVLALDAIDALGARLLFGTAAWIWRAVDRPVTVEEIVAFIQEEFVADAPSIDGQVREFLNQLRAQGLLITV